MSLSKYIVKTAVFQRVTNKSLKNKVEKIWLRAKLDVENPTSIRWEVLFFFFLSLQNLNVYKQNLLKQFKKNQFFLHFKKYKQWCILFIF